VVVLYLRYRSRAARGGVEQGGGSRGALRRRHHADKAPETAISVNSVPAKTNGDGSSTIRFGGDPKAPNYLRIMPGWKSS
jgi:hypothetical protein